MKVVKRDEAISLMKTLSILLDSTQDGRIISHHSQLVLSSQKIILLYVVKDKWFSFNDPRSILASLQAMNQSEGIKRKNIIHYLNEVEGRLKEINKEVEVVKIVVFGGEKYKVTRCLRLLKVEMCVMRSKKRSIVEKIFSKSLQEYISEELQIPVVISP